MAKVRCAFCDKRTKVRPIDAGKSSQFARLPHAPTKLGFKTFPPLCVAARQGRTAQVQAVLLLANCVTCQDEANEPDERVAA